MEYFEENDDVDTYYSNKNQETTIRSLFDTMTLPHKNSGDPHSAIDEIPLPVTGKRMRDNKKPEEYYDSFYEDYGY